jgi:hypothetical protein
MTLSRFLRDYIYIPLGGNKISSFRTYVNLLATFVIGGLWHGAGWTFIFWGFLHGMALIIHRVWSNLGFKMYTWLAWFITFNFVNIAWIFFRAKNWEDAIKVLSSMLSLSNVVLPNLLESKLQFFKSFGITFGGFVGDINGDYFTPLWIIIGFIFVLFSKNSMEKWNEFKVNYKTLFLTFICLLAGLLSLNKVSEFLYFNF